MPYSIRLPDGTLVTGIPDEVNPEDAKKRIIAAGLVKPAVTPEQPPSKDRTVTEQLVDPVAQVGTGVGSVLQFPGQLVSLVPGLRGVGEALATPGAKLSEVSEGLKSASLKAREVYRSKKLTEAEKDGFLAEFGTAVSETVKDPALLTGFFFEQIPQLLGPAAAVKLTKMLGQGVIKNAAPEVVQQAQLALNKRAATAAVGTGAAMQGADIGADTYKAVYDLAISQGKSEEEAKAIAEQKARIAAAEAAVVSLATSKLPGGSAIERRLAGLQGVPGAGRIGTGVREAFTESLEEAGGAVSKGVALSEVDPTISPLTGAGAAAGFGALGGLGLGALVGGAKVPDAAAAPRTDEDRIDTLRQEATQRYEEKRAPVTQAQALIEATKSKPISEAYPELTQAIELLKQGEPTRETAEAIKALEQERVARSTEDIKELIKSKKFLSAEEAAQAGVISRDDPIVQRLIESQKLQEKRDSLLVNGKKPAKKSPARKQYDELTAQIDQLEKGEEAPSAETTLIEEPKVRSADTLPEVLDAKTINKIGFSRGAIFNALVGKNIADPEIRTILEGYKQRSGDKAPSATTVAKVDAFLAKLPEQVAPATPPAAETTPTPAVNLEAEDVGQTLAEPSGVSPGVASEPGAGAPTEGLGVTEPSGVVPVVEDAGQTAVGEGQQPAAVDEAPAETPAVALTLEDLKAQQQALLTKAGKVPAKKSPARQKYDALQAQIDALPRKGEDLKNLTPAQREELYDEVERISGMIPVEVYDGFMERHVTEDGSRIKRASESIKVARELIAKYGEGKSAKYRTIPQSPLVQGVVNDAELRKIVADIEQALGGSVNITILDDVTDIDNKQAPGTRAGAVIGGEIYLFRSGIANGIEGQKSVFHEVFHKGLAKLLPRAEYQALMIKFYNQSTAVRAGADAYLASDVGKKDTAGLSEQDTKILAVEEALAEMSESSNLTGSTLQQLRNFFAKLADRFGMPQLARAIRTMGLDPLQAFIRDAIQAGIQPGQVALDRFRPGTSAFKKWFGDSKVVDEKGEPLVIYRGVRGGESITEEALSGGARGGYAAFGSDSPYVANTYGTPDFEWGESGAITPLYIKADKLIEFPVQERADGTRTFSKTEFDRRAQELRPGEVLVARQVLDFGPNSPQVYKFDKEKKYANYSDIYAWNKGTSVKSATGNVGAYGQRPVTAEEAKRLGMTQEEAAQAQRAGDIRFRTKPKALVGKEEDLDKPGYFGTKLGENKVVGARVKLADSQAGVAAYLSPLWGGKVVSKRGEINPEFKLARALDWGRFSLAMQREGTLVRDPGGLAVVKKLTVDENSFSPKELARLDLVQGQDVSVTSAYQKIAKSKLGKEKIDELLAGEREYQLYQKREELEEAGKELKFFYTEEEAAAIHEEFMASQEAREIAQTFDAVRFKMIDFLVDTGRWSAEKGADMKRVLGYMPFQRISALDESYESRSSRRGVAVFRNLRNYRGSEVKQVRSPTEAFSNLMDWMTAEGMKNEATSHSLNVLELIGVAERIGDSSQVDDNEKFKVIPSYKDGKKMFYFAKDPAIVPAFNVAPREYGSIVRGIQSASKLLRAGVTSTPPFVFKQIVDDVTRVFAFSKLDNPLMAAGNMLLNFPANWARELRGVKSPSTKRLEKLGVYGTYDFSDEGNVGHIMEEGGLTKPSMLSKVYRIMEAGAKASDISVREAIYDQARKEGKDEVTAEYMAREIINFSRRGSSNTMDFFIRTVPFFNAYAQGFDKLVAAAGGKVVGANAAVARATFWRRAIVLVGLGVMYGMLMSDDEEYNNLSDNVRDRNIILPFNKEFVEKYGVVPAIPLPADLAFLFKAIPERIIQYYRLHGTDEERSALELTRELLRSGYDVFGSPNITPQAIRPLLENMINYSFFLGRPLESQSQQRIAAYLREGASTSDTMKATSEVLNQVGVEISPIKLENFVRGMLGSISGIILSVGDTLINPSRTDRPLHQMIASQVTGASAFMKGALASKAMDRLYNLEKDSVEAKMGLDKLLEGTDTDKAADHYQKYYGYIMVYDDVQSLMREVSDLSKTAREIDKAEAMPPEERRQAINMIRVMQNEYARRAATLSTTARTLQLQMNAR